MRRIAVLGAVILAVSLVTGILNVTWDWNGIPVPLGPFECRSPSTRPSS